MNISTQYVIKRIQRIKLLGTLTVYILIVIKCIVRNIRGIILIRFMIRYITTGKFLEHTLITLIGINMIREALSKKEDEADASLAFGLMLRFAVATSIDALATGVGYGMNPAEIALFSGLDVLNITLTSLMIGITTFTLSAIGVKVGSVFGNKYEKKAEFVGGCVLIVLGIKMVVECLIGVFAS